MSKYLDVEKLMDKSSSSNIGVFEEIQNEDIFPSNKSGRHKMCSSRLVDQLSFMQKLLGFPLEKRY